MHRLRGAHGGTVPVSAVQERVLEDNTVPVALGLGAMLGVAAGLTGAGCGPAGWLSGRLLPVVYA